jgi:hypothetical protein
MFSDFSCSARFVISKIKNINEDLSKCLKIQLKKEKKIMEQLPHPNLCPKTEGLIIDYQFHTSLLPCLAPPKRQRESEGRRGWGDEVSIFFLTLN